MYGLLNLGSLILGLIALSIPVMSLLKKRYSSTNVITMTFVSALFTAISLFMQILYTKYLTDISDWSALMDTQGAVTYAALILLISTIVLNGLVIIRNKGIRT